jgi:predicted nucleic acid-binding protein
MRTAIADTCCLINLYASQRLSAIIAASIEQAFVPNIVLSECLYIRQQSEDKPNQVVSVTVDLHPLIDAGILFLTDLAGEVELDRFVQLATLIDDCEAACLAIAAVRGLALATDDRRAIQVATDLGVSVVTTPELLKNWKECGSPEQHEVTEAILRIEKYGRFRPHSTCAYARWWAEQRLL